MGRRRPAGKASSQELQKNSMQGAKKREEVEMGTIEVEAGSKERV
jgi:hypothetical protein